MAAPFRPFDDALDQDAALARLREAVAGADDGELFLERRRSEVLSFDDGRLKTASFDASEGFGLRAVRGETAGYAHSTEVSEPALARAVATARLAVGAGGGTLAGPPARTNRKLYGDMDPIEDSTFPAKVETLREIDAFARGLDPRVVQVSATVSASHQEVAILRPEGGLVTDVRPMTRLNVSVIVEENGRREAGGHGSGGRHGLLGLISRDAVEGHHARGAAHRPREPARGGRARGRHGRGAGAGLAGRPAPRGGGPRARGRLQPQGHLGLRGAHGDAGGRARRHRARRRHPPDRRGSLTVDDEGTPSQRNVLIEDGILVGFMQDRQNARLMGVAPTGNGRRESFAHIPMPRMTNTYMLAGEADPQAMVAALRDGLYAVGFGGGQVDITNGKFVFSCTEAYRVRNGRVEEPVKGATLIGDGRHGAQGDPRHRQRPRP
jgi:TldD protein